MADDPSHPPVTPLTAPALELLDAWKRAASVSFRDRLEEIKYTIAEQLASAEREARDVSTTDLARRECLARADQAKSLLLQVRFAIEAIEEERADWAARHTYTLMALAHEFIWARDVLLGRRQRRSQSEKAAASVATRRERLDKVMAAARTMKASDPDIKTSHIALTLSHRFEYSKAYLERILGPHLKKP